MAAANKRACTQATADHEISLCILEPSVAKFAPDAVPEYVPDPDGTCPILTETRYTNPPMKTRGSYGPSKDGWSVWAWVLAILKRLAALGTQADTMETRHQEMVASNLVAAAAMLAFTSSIDNLKLRVDVLEMKNSSFIAGMTTVNQALTVNQEKINEVAKDLAQLSDLADNPSCPVTGLNQFEEMHEALDEMTEAVVALQGEVIPRLDALEDTVVQMPIDMRQHVEFRMNVWLQFMSKLHDLESVVDAQHALIRTLPKKHAISWLGGRITNLDERMHSLAGTFTDHEELTQVRQEQLRTELLIRLDPPVL